MEEDRGGAQFRRDADRRADLRHLRGVPDRQEDAADRRRDDRARVRARRAAHGDRHRAQRPRVLHARGEPDDAIRAGGPCFRSSPPKSASIWARSRSATASSSPRTRSSSRGRRFSSSKGAASGLFAEGAEKLREGVDDQQALLIGIKCERGSHEFFKRYGERFEDSEGKQIFLEFADEERAHLDLLTREYRTLGERQNRPRAPADGRSEIRPGDRSPHPHDRVGRPLHAGGARRARVGGRRHRAGRHRPRYGGRLRGGGGRVPRAGIEFVHGHPRSPRSRDDVDVHVLGYFIDVTSPALLAFLAQQRHRRIDRVRQMIERLVARRHSGSTPTPSSRRRWTIDTSPPAGRGLRARWWPAGMWPPPTRRSIAGSSAWTPGVRGPRMAASPADVFARIHQASGIASLAHPGPRRARRLDSRVRRRRSGCARGVSQRTRRRCHRSLSRHGRATGRRGDRRESDYHGGRLARAPSNLAAWRFPRDAYERTRVRLKPDATKGCD